MSKRVCLNVLFTLTLVGFFVSSCCSKSDKSCSTTSDTTKCVNSAVCPKTCGVNDLGGDIQWSVIAISGNDIQPKEAGPFLSFDTQNNKIHGNAGCNVINASYVTVDSIPMSLVFQPGQVTMMACPDLEIEQAFLAALPTVTSFEFVSVSDSASCCAEGKSTLLLKNKDGQEVMKLKKKK